MQKSLGGEANKRYFHNLLSFPNDLAKGIGDDRVLQITNVHGVENIEERTVSQKGCKASLCPAPRYDLVGSHPLAKPCFLLPFSCEIRLCLLAFSRLLGQHNVGSGAGGVGGARDSNADISLLECGSVVHAVTGHAHLIPQPK